MVCEKKDLKDMTQFSITYRLGKFSKDSVDLRTMIMKRLEYSLPTITWYFTEPRNRSLLYFDSSKFDGSCFQHFECVEFSSFIELFESKEHIQTHPMLMELGQEFEKDRRGLIMKICDNLCLFLLVEVIREKNVVVVRDYIKQCYNICIHCKLSYIGKGLKCDICNDFCCHESCMDHHISRCSSKSIQNVCAILFRNQGTTEFVETK
jgi:hypothetical protein